MAPRAALALVASLCLASNQASASDEPGRREASAAAEPKSPLEKKRGETLAKLDESRWLLARQREQKVGRAYADIAVSIMEAKDEAALDGMGPMLDWFHRRAIVGAGMSGLPPREIERVKASQAAAIEEMERRKIGGQASWPRDTALRPPVDPKDFYGVTSPFDPKRKHPLSKIETPHLGLDGRAQRPVPIRASADGWIIFTGMDPLDPKHGNRVIVRYDNGMFGSVSHLSRFPAYIGSVVSSQKSVGTKFGQLPAPVRVREGQIIGYSGATGGVNGPHWHAEVGTSPRGGRFDPEGAYPSLPPLRPHSGSLTASEKIP
ncbi:MAG: M23 family metallopeptidase [Elusimicrobia bacterium]|nr:M23 family metallopeptidase [Elusimicrobiota bacterium]